MKKVTRNVGTVASSTAGTLRVDASAGEVALRVNATTALSPTMARELGSLLVLAADVAERETGGK
jgi:hypothetical protein